MFGFARLFTFAIGVITVVTLCGQASKAADENIFNPSEGFEASLRASGLTDGQISEVFVEFSNGETVRGLALIRDYITHGSNLNFTSGIGQFWQELKSALPATKGPLDVAMDDKSLEASGAFSQSVSKALEDKRNSELPSGIRVWGGAKVLEPDVYRDVVGIVASGGKSCSGTLVTKDIVVSAAHCFCAKVNETVILGQELAASNERIAIDLDRSGSFIPCELLGTNSKIVKNIDRGDVAVFRLKESVQNVPVRMIASNQMIQTAASVRTVGFGVTNDFSSGVKYYVDVIIASHNCDGVSEGKSHSDMFGCRPRRELVAAGLNRDTCAGDSGGPSFVLGADAKLFLAAATSRAVDKTGKCGPGGIYVKLTSPPIKEWLIEMGVPPQSFAN